MKRLLSFFLSALMVMTLGVPALAAGEQTDQRLAQVTAKVKKTLGIGDAYTDFYGELRENELAPVWSLNWEREEDSIRVTAAEDGQVLSYTLSENGDTSSDYTFPPAFPAVTEEQARTYAEAFLKKVLDGSLETAVFSEQAYNRLDTGSCRFSGEIRLNGLPAPLSFSLTVRTSDGKVTRFYRDNLEESVTGGVPSATPAAKQADAGKLLKDTLALRLEYVLDEEGKTASLRYLPESGDDYFVDAQTGKLVNLTELYEEAWKSAANDAGLMNAASAAPEAEAAADTAAGLSQAEQAGVAKLEGVQSKESLDKKLRETAGLGLDKYTLSSANYSLDQDSGDVTARMVYTRREEAGIWRRTVSCDARTGALLSVYSYAPYGEERTDSLGEAAAREKAEAFLKELWGEAFSAAALYDSEPWTADARYSAAHSFTYSQQANGYFLPANSLFISVDITDGSISALNRQWTEGVDFDSAEGIVDQKAALAAWFGHYDVTLAYRSIPVKLDLSQDASPLTASLLEMGYAYFYKLQLTYTLTEPEGQICSGVDAKTGKVVFRESGAGEAALTYSDLEGSWAKTPLETLARYGIGWSGGVCRPKQELTQIDLVALLVSADGYRYGPEEGDADNLYLQAYHLGILTPAERQDKKLLTRGESVKLLLDCAGFGSTAKLQGIFTCSYADADQIPASLLGYAALAQGLGVVNASGSFSAGQTATRAEAAVMLYNLMNR